MGKKVYSYDESRDWRAYDAVELPFPPTFDKVRSYPQGNFDAVMLPFPPPYDTGRIEPLPTYDVGTTSIQPELDDGAG